MTISAYLQDTLIGPRDYMPEGPKGTSGNFPVFSTKPGTVSSGDSEGSFVFLLLAVHAAVTYNQGDFFCWDNSYNASPVGEINAASEYFEGTAVGTLFFGGIAMNPANPSSSGNIWSYTFNPGVYGIWVQRYGTSLMNLQAISTGATLTFPATSATAASITMQAAAAATTFNSCPVGTICNAPLSKTFTGNTVTGSAVITNVNTTKFLVPGMQLTGTGFAAVSTTQNGTFILDIQGSTVLVSTTATATNTGTTFTALNSQTTGTVISGSKQITGCPFVNGLYPNQIITGTGVVSLTIASIGGTPGNWTINLTTAATVGAAPNIRQITLAAAPNYYEGFLRNPYYNIAL